MKKLLLLVSAVVLAVGLAGCKPGVDVPGLTEIVLSGIADAEVTVGDSFNALTGVTAMGDDDVDYSAEVTVDSETCVIAADGTVDTSTAKICVLNYTVVVEGKFVRGSMTLTIKPEEIIIEDAPLLMSWDFEDASDLEGWAIYVANGGSIDMSVEDGAMKLVTTSGGARYETRLDYMGVPLEEGYDYKVSFKMKSDIDGKKVHLNFGELLPANPWFTPFKAEGIDIITLTTEWVEYSYTFNMALDNQNGGPLFEMGNMDGSTGLDATMWIDDLKIEGGSGSDTVGPAITGVDNVIIELGDAFDALAGVAALDFVDGDLTSAIVLSGDTVDVNTAGVYTLTYTVEDAAGNETVATRTVTVVGFVLDVNNTAVSDAFDTDMVIGADESAAWYTTITWGQPIFTAEFVGGQLVMSGAKDGDKDYGTDYWNHIVRFTEMKFIEGVEYKIVFDAMTDEVDNTTNNIMFKVEAGSFGAETQMLVPNTMGTLEFVFTWGAPTTTEGSLLFFVGGREQVITVENLVVYISSSGANIVNVPAIEGAEDATVEVGATVDLLDGVTAFDIEDGALVPVVTVLGPTGQTVFDSNVVGAWEVTYTATDADMHETVVVVTITVDDPYVMSFEESAWMGWFGDQWSGLTTSTAMLVDGVLEVDVMYEGTPATYATQIYQEGFAVENGKFYRISFDAKADAAKDILVAFGDALDADPWFTDFVAKSTISLTTDMTTYVIEFEMTEPTTADQGKLVFELATAVTTKVYIDNVKLEEITALLGDVVADTDQVVDGTFEQIEPEGLVFEDSAWMAWYGDQWSGPTTSVVEIVRGELVVDVIYEGTPQTYATQVYQEGFAVENGKFYRISFDARADLAKDIMVAFGDALDADPWFTEFVAKQTISLTTDMQTFEIEFEMTQPTTADQGKLVFELATAVLTKVYIDNVMIEEIDALGGTAVADSNQVVEGDFELVEGPMYIGYGMTAVDGAGFTTITYADTPGNWWENNSQLSVVDFDGTKTSIIFTFTGTAGHEYLFKIEGGGQFVELPIVADGTEQTLELPLGGMTEAQRAGLNLIIFFVKTAGASGSAVVNDWVYGDTPEAPDLTNIIDFTTGTYTSGDAGVYTYSVVNGETVVDYAKGAGQEWSYGKIEFDPSAAAGLNTMTLVLQGTAGKTVLIKPNDNGALEQTVTFGAEPVTVVVTAEQFNNLIFFAEPNTASVSGQFTILSATLSYTFTTTAWVDGPDGVYTITVTDGVTAVAYDKGAGQEWSYFRIDFDAADVAGLNTLTLVLSGTEGKTVLVKPNDNGALEQSVTFGTEPVTLTISAESFTSIIVFGEPNTASVTGSFEITSTTLSFVDAPILPVWAGFGGTTVVENGDGSVDITYDVNTQWWWDFSAQHLNVNLDGTTFNAIDFTFTGVDTHEYKFKVEYDGGAKETGAGVVGNGAEQTVTLDLSTLTPEQLSSINKIVVFPSAQGQVGTVTVSYALTTVAVDTSTLADMPNQEFTDADISGWGVEGSLTLAHDITNGWMVVTVTELGANPWDQNIGFAGQNVVAGNTYEVTFVIKTAFAAGRDVTFFVENTDAGYAKYFEETRTLTDQFQTFTFSFTPTANNDDCKLGIFLGNTTNPLIGDVVIDSITITETVPAS